MVRYTSQRFNLSSWLTIMFKTQGACTSLFRWTLAVVCTRVQKWPDGSSHQHLEDEYKMASVINKMFFRSATRKLAAGRCSDVSVESRLFGCQRAGLELWKWAWRWRHHVERVWGKKIVREWVSEWANEWSTECWPPIQFCKRKKNVSKREPMTEWMCEEEIDTRTNEAVSISSATRTSFNGRAILVCSCSGGRTIDRWNMAS